ncbi:energy-coupling factor transporter ATPase [Aquisalibacillus elongatus]|uniref:Energy-coupling factor transporter ATP-binding protein EcfA2 n=1 Tax=Aquisalibacillus elongatus TaxID=485577 RepID=A0A3N5AYG9_9BACI|nr:energy-coupling factor transporter ATPase [Aquisalibacillus elongatus]RPF50017.1 energy-coupling factor transport system ATP-binding protein [Aquisalibacillus elongatus]
MDISFNQVSFTYQKGTPFEHHALHNVSTSISSGTMTAVIGQTGSGKSTFIQHVNGLYYPTEGSVEVGDFTITQDGLKSIKKLRQQVGMVFQYPEHQLFEENVRQELLFGPRNFGLEVSDSRLNEIFNMVGLPNEVLEKSPFELSGGQKRRVAIASVLVLEPKVLILDEPTAGLDPAGKQQIMNLFKSLQVEKQMTVVWITHDMTEVLTYADNVIVFHEGKLMGPAAPKALFRNKELLAQTSLNKPSVLKFLDELKDQIGVSINYNDQSAIELADEIIKVGEKS